MSRLMNQEKAGYYPLDPDVTALIATAITAPHGGRLLDPCIGKGVAAHMLGTRLGLDVYGVELNSDRAAAAQHLIGKGAVLCDDYRNLRVPPESFNLLYNNPPYMAVADKSAGRAEYQWLRDTRPHLQRGGLLVWVVPRHILCHRKARRYLATWFDALRVYRLPDPFYERFKQVVVFGTRRAKSGLADPERVERLDGMGKGDIELIPLKAPDDPLYTLPALTGRPFHFRSLFVDPETALAEAAAGLATGDEWRKHLAPTAARRRLEPLTPLKIGHMNSIIAAGHLNNQVIADGDERLLIKGHSYKKVRKHTAHEDLADGRTKVTHTATENVTTTITTATPDGEIVVRDGNDLEAFLTAWLPQLTAIVAAEYPPRYQFDLNGYGPTIKTLNQGRTIPLVGKPGLLPAQAHAAAAVATHLETKKAAFVVGEMGVGKTLIGPAIAACRGAERTLVLCPPHLVEKWLREIRVTWPEAHAMHLKTIADVDAFFAYDAGPVMGVMKETSARLASGWRHAFNWLGPAALGHRSRKADWELEHHSQLAPASGDELGPVLAGNEALLKRLRVRCSTCGAVVGDGDGGAASPATFARKQLQCHKCSSPLYQDKRRRSQSQVPGSFNRYAKRERAIRQALKQGRAPDTDHPTPNDLHGYAKYPLATYILRHYSGQLDLLIGDECHQFKGGSSDRGYAFQRLVSASRKVVGLTGTVYGGKASSLFHLLYRMVPAMKDEYDHNDVRKWVKSYGIMQEEETSIMDEDGKLTGNSRSRPRLKELPGGSPAMLPWLLNRSVFISLQDMGFALPAYEEIPVGVAMTAAQKAMYDDLRGQLMAELQERLVRGDKSLLAGYLQSLLAWPDSPWREKVVRDPKTDQVVARVPGLPADRRYPKEEAIIKQIQNELAQDRKVLLLCQQTGTLDITPQWQEMLRKAGISSAVLTCEPGRRERWVKEQLGRGVQVIISHPRRVETGLDLLEFPTIVWMGTEYSVYTVLQASRRSWRIGQTKPVKVYFYAYEDTIQEDALSLIAAKVAATLRVNGDTVADDSLAELDELAGADIVTALARIAIGDAGRAPSLQDAFRKANDDFKTANTVIGEYEMADIPQPQALPEGAPEPDPAPAFRNGTNGVAQEEAVTAIPDEIVKKPKPEQKEERLPAAPVGRQMAFSFA